MLFIISFDVLSGYVIKLDYSFRFLNFDKFCDTAPLNLSTTYFTKKSVWLFLLALLIYSKTSIKRTPN